LTKPEFKPDPVLNTEIDKTFVKDEYEPLGKPVYVKKETALDAMAGDGGYQETYLGDTIRFKMKRDKKRFWAGDNISEYILDERMKEQLIDEATEAFETVLDRLLIDRENDPNSKGTARRLAKMYFNEIMAGRYEQVPQQQHFRMIRKTVTKVCWLFAASFAVCVAIITNLLLALLILVLLLPKNSSASRNIQESPSGVQDAELSRRNLLMTLLGRSKKPQEPKT